MRILRWATYLWPGLAPLWFEGAWAGLIVALGFVLMVDLLVVVSLIWVELLDATLVGYAWLVLAILWAAALVFIKKGGKSGTPAEEDLFRQAMTEYLRGDWFEAESLLKRLVAANASDVDARLMLVSLLRHARRFSDAQRQLAELARLRRADRWRYEILYEQERLREAQEEAETTRLPAGAVVPSLAAKAA